MTLVDDFYAPWEEVITSFGAINSIITNIFERRIAEGRRFAWRGVVDASWPLHSSLYRKLLWTRGGLPAPNESVLFNVEGDLLRRVHRWGLHNGERGRLSILEQLATLQHFGSPTRLIDVTMNAYVGLWFAVQEKWRETVDRSDEADGRLFAVDITDRLINEHDEYRAWEDKRSRPWRDLDGEEWLGKTWAWLPPAFEARIASQHGAFIFGGVPRTNIGVIWPKEPGQPGRWPINQVRRCVSVPLRLHKARPERGGVSTEGQPAYTFRIPASAKSDIRDRLSRVFAYRHSTVYPDYPGFAQYGAADLLRDSPPDS
jgi:hypothetical protein